MRAWREVRLPAAPVPLPHRTPGGVRWSRDGPRVVLCARVEGPAGSLTVVTTHLSGAPGAATAQLRRLTPAALAVPGPLVLLGDLGGARDPAAATGLAPLVAPDAAPAAGRGVDHVLGRGVRARGPAAAVPLEVSDHRAVLVELELDG